MSNDYAWVTTLAVETREDVTKAVEECSRELFLLEGSVIPPFVAHAVERVVKKARAKGVECYALLDYMEAARADGRWKMVSFICCRCLAKPLRRKFSTGTPPAGPIGLSLRTYRCGRCNEEIRKHYERGGKIRHHGLYLVPARPFKELDPYPLHTKILNMKKEHAAVQAFLDHLSDTLRIILAERIAGRWHTNEGELVPTTKSAASIVASFFRIDMKAFEAEKRLMLETQRELNNDQEEP